MLASFPKLSNTVVEYVASETPKNATPLLYVVPFPGNPRKYLESLGYIVVADSVVYLHSNFRGGEDARVFKHSA